MLENGQKIKLPKMEEEKNKDKNINQQNRKCFLEEQKD